MTEVSLLRKLTLRAFAIGFALCVTCTVASGQEQLSIDAVAAKLGDEQAKARLDELIRKEAVHTEAVGDRMGLLAVGSNTTEADKEFIAEQNRYRALYLKLMEDSGMGDIREKFAMRCVGREVKLRPPDQKNSPQVRRSPPPPPLPATHKKTVLEVSPFFVATWAMNEPYAGDLKAADVVKISPASGAVSKAVDLAVANASREGARPRRIWNPLDGPPPAGMEDLERPDPEETLNAMFIASASPAKQKTTMLLHVGFEQSWLVFSVPAEKGSKIKVLRLPVGTHSMYLAVNKERKKTEDDTFAVASARRGMELARSMLVKPITDCKELSGVRIDELRVTGLFGWAFFTLAKAKSVHAIDIVKNRILQGKANSLFGDAAETAQEEEVLEIERTLFARDELMSGAIILSSLNDLLHWDRLEEDYAGKKIAGTGEAPVTVKVDRQAVISVLLH